METYLLFSAGTLDYSTFNYFSCLHAQITKSIQANAYFIISNKQFFLIIFSGCSSISFQHLIYSCFSFVVSLLNYLKVLRLIVFSLYK